MALSAAAMESSAAPVGVPEQRLTLRGRPPLAGADRRGERAGAYADRKLFVTTLAAAVAPLRSGVPSNAVEPGWVPTRMRDRAHRTIAL